MYLSSLVMINITNTLPTDSFSINGCTINNTMTICFVYSDRSFSEMSQVMYVTGEWHKWSYKLAKEDDGREGGEPSCLPTVHCSGLSLPIFFFFFFLPFLSSNTDHDPQLA